MWLLGPGIILMHLPRLVMDEPRCVSHMCCAAQGAWEYAFDKDSTMDVPFTTAPNKTVAVPMMYKSFKPSLFRSLPPGRLIYIADVPGQFRAIKVGLQVECDLWGQEGLPCSTHARGTTHSCQVHASAMAGSVLHCVTLSAA
jgi:hypothetical protein